MTFKLNVKNVDNFKVVVEGLLKLFEDNRSFKKKKKKMLNFSQHSNVQKNHSLSKKTMKLNNIVIN